MHTMVLLRAPVGSPSAPSPLSFTPTLPANPQSSPVTTEKGVTSDPVPEVVGMHTMVLLRAPVGSSYTLLRMSMKRMARPSNLVSGTWKCGAGAGGSVRGERRSGVLGRLFFSFFFFLFFFPEQCNRVRATLCIEGRERGGAEANTWGEHGPAPALQDPPCLIPACVRTRRSQTKLAACPHLEHEPHDLGGIHGEPPAVAPMTSGFKPHLPPYCLSMKESPCGRHDIGSMHRHSNPHLVHEPHDLGRIHGGASTHGYDDVGLELQHLLQPRLNAGQRGVRGHMVEHLECGEAGAGKVREERCGEGGVEGHVVEHLECGEGARQIEQAPSVGARGRCEECARPASNK